MDKRYIGDGVYVAYDGHGLILTTEDGVSVTNRIYLEPSVIDAMSQYNRDVAAEIRGRQNGKPLTTEKES